MCVVRPSLNVFVCRLERGHHYEGGAAWKSAKLEVVRGLRLRRGSAEGIRPLGRRRSTGEDRRITRNEYGLRSFADLFCLF